jgi:Trk K+ transport system NAD-binding subunit
MPLMPLTGSHLELIEAEVAPGAPSAGKTVHMLGLPPGSAVGGIVRRGAVLHADDDTALEVGDRVIVLAPTKDETDVRRALLG